MGDVDVVVTPTPPIVVEVEQEGVATTVELPAPPPSVVEVRVPGPQGPPGVTPVGGSDAHFVHPQIPAVSQVVVEHGLGKHPAVTVTDTSGKEVHGSVVYLDADTVLLGFSAPFSFTAVFN